MEQQEQHLTTREVADRYRVKRGTLAMWRVRGKGPCFIKVGRTVLYPIKDVEAFERRQRRIRTIDDGELAESGILD